MTGSLASKVVYTPAFLCNNKGNKDVKIMELEQLTLL